MSDLHCVCGSNSNKRIKDLEAQVAALNDYNGKMIKTYQSEVDELVAQVVKLEGLNADWEVRCKAFHRSTGG